MKLNKIDKVWPVRIHFLSDVFGLLWSKNFAAMASWRNDFSSLLYVNEIHDVICVNVFFRQQMTSLRKKD